MINYSNGKTFQNKLIKITQINTHKKSFNAGNRGMDFEADINISNEFYKQNGLCLITKRPTPINVVKVDYSKGAKITDAYFEKPSTTDYNGVFKGKYIDFEAKSTRAKTSFPLSNISKHQIEHLKLVLKNQGICFFLIEFSQLNIVYLLDAKYVIEHYEKDKRRSIPYSQFKENGYLVEKGYLPRLKYLDVIKKVYFSE